MKQSRWQSLLEAKLNTISAFFISWATMAWVIPLLFPVTGVNASNSFGIVMVFTLISIVRNYFIRRLFNYLEKN